MPSTVWAGWLAIFSHTLTEPSAYDTIALTVRACTGFDRPAEDGEAIRGL